MNLPIYEGFFFPSDGYGGFVSAGFTETLCSYEHRVLMPMSERSSVLRPADRFFMHFFQFLSGLTGCGCLGIIIVISGNVRRNWSLDSALLTRAIFSFLYLRERREGETRRSLGAYLSLKSHLCALSLLILKGVSIAMPNLVEVLIKGLLYCYSLHNRVRDLWKLMAQQSPVILSNLYLL